MGQDLSVLFVPGKVDADELGWRISNVLAGHSHDVLVTLVDRSAGPEHLADHFDDYLAISLWSEDPFEWDQVAAAVTRELGAPALGVSIADHACMGCWQPFEGGVPGTAHWLEEDYADAGERGFKAVYELTLPSDDLFFVESLATGAPRGLWIKFEPEVVIEHLDEQELEDCIEGGIFECCPLAHTLSDSVTDPPLLESGKLPVSPDADTEDRELVEALLALEGLSPAKRVFVEDLKRSVLVAGKAMTEGQRERGRGLLDKLGEP